MRLLHKTLCNAAFVLIGACAPGAGAQSNGGPFRIEPAAVANGGGTMAGGSFQLRGTIGQAQTSTLTAAPFRFYGGFWTLPSDTIFASGFE
ncbi:MAG TPA: hypothetical protein VHQ21_10020 [Rhodanobacteraceae bacterium]|jgi:hypothetical protein|nr:hypothetical protein [Rhodanobacteraceae bacterium]